MGQYYVVINIDKKEYMRPEGGVKLMEWSYNRNPLILNLLHKLANQWKGDRVYVVGDYAISQDRINKKDNSTIKEYDYDTLEKIEKQLDIYDKKERNGYNVTLYNYAYDTFEEVALENIKDEEYRYIYNHNKKEYIDLSHCPLAWLYKEKNKYFQVKVAPISLLLALGNGMGGGDYWGNNDSMVGNYINDVDKLEITKEPLKVDYLEYRPEFYEGEYIPYNEIENAINKEKGKTKLVKEIVDFIYINDIEMFKNRYKSKNDAISKIEFSIDYNPKNKPPNTQEILEIIQKSNDINAKEKGEELIEKISNYKLEKIIKNNKNKLDIELKNESNEDIYINEIYKRTLEENGINNIKSIITNNKKTLIVFETQEECNIETENKNEIKDFIENSKKIYKRSNEQKEVIKFVEIKEKVPQKAKVPELFYYECKENENGKIIEQGVWADYTSTLIANKDILKGKEFLEYNNIFKNNKIMMLDDNSIREEVIQSLQIKTENEEENEC